MTPEAEWKIMREALLREMDKDIFTVASPGHVRVSQDDLEAAEEVLVGPDAIQEDFAPIFMDYGHYGSDTDGPPDHDTSSWSPLDDVEEDPDESLSPAYVSRTRPKENRMMKNTSRLSEVAVQATQHDPMYGPVLTWVHRKGRKPGTLMVGTRDGSDLREVPANTVKFKFGIDSEKFGIPYTDPYATSESRSRGSNKLQEFVRGMGPAAGVRAMPEYQQFLDFVMHRDIPGIHPDDVLSRWRRMFPNVRLTSGQIEQLHAALEDDGALDKPAYESKSFPFTQARLSESKLIRRFSHTVNDQELTWHRDREPRIVRVVEGKGWSLQLDNKLPRPMRLGESYEIPAGHWHRLIRHDGATNLCIIIKELKKGDRVKHKGKKATVKVPDARGPLIGIDPDGPKDMEMVPDDEVKPVKEAKKKGLWANIHAKRKRGGKPAKPGDKNYPDEKSLKAAQGKG